MCRLMAKTKSYDETMTVLSEWQTYGQSRDVELGNANQELQKLRAEVATLHRQAEIDRSEISGLRQQVRLPRGAHLWCDCTKGSSS